MMTKKQRGSLRVFRLMIPLLIGIAVTGILFYQEFYSEAWGQFRFTWVEGACITLYSDERFEYDVAVPVDVWTGQTILATGFSHKFIV